MKIKDITETGFYKAIDNESFIIEVLHLSNVSEIYGVTEEEIKENQDTLFVDVWYHDEDAPYKHDKNTYQSNGMIYKIDSIPDIFENMDFIDDSSYDHQLCGKEKVFMRRVEKEITAKPILN